MLPINSLNPFRYFCMTIGELPSSYVESMSYAELLTWFCNYLENKVIPAVNNNAEALKEVQNLVLEIKAYVENYFDSPEFLEDVSNKLDEMAEDGTLDALINTNLIGSLSDLNTTDKSSIVNAINEVNTKSYITPTLSLSHVTHSISWEYQFPPQGRLSSLNNVFYCNVPNYWKISCDLDYTLTGGSWSLIVDGVDVTATNTVLINDGQALIVDVICPHTSVELTVTAIPEE